MNNRCQRVATAKCGRSETVNLDLRLRETFLRKEGRYLEALVTLKLDNLTESFVFDDGSVASEFLNRQPCQQSSFERGSGNSLTFLNAFKSFLGSYSDDILDVSEWSKVVQGTVRTFREPLKRCQGLPSVPLLNTDVKIVLLRSNVLRFVEFVVTSEGVCPTNNTAISAVQHDSQRRGSLPRVARF